MNHQFHPWEGGEGKIPAQYKSALIHLAQKEPNRDKAAALLERALVYPHNLGEGKLIGSFDNDIYYLLGNLYKDTAKREQALRLAARGDFQPTSAMYYNDQPPEMMYYAALARRALGEEQTAQAYFDRMIDYAKTHMHDKIKIEYFAVSLPDFLIFDADLDRKNTVHCYFMDALGFLGKGDAQTAREYAQAGQKLDKCHAGLHDVLSKVS